MFKLSQFFLSFLFLSLTAVAEPRSIPQRVDSLEKDISSLVYDRTKSTNLPDIMEAFGAFLGFKREAGVNLNTYKKQLNAHMDALPSYDELHDYITNQSLS